MSTNYKGNLAVGGTAFDKSKLLRRPTPDSDALASSDDDRDHVPSTRTVNNPAFPTGRRPSSGWLQDIQPNRKFSLPSVSFAGSQPTTPSELPQQSRPTTSSFPWNTSSFTSNPAGTRLKEVLPSPTSAHPLGDKSLPSPTIESDETINFLLNQQNAVRKSVRSQSYSVGQGTDTSPAQLSSRLPSSLRHRPSKPSLLGESALGLGQLREDDIDEFESNNGSEQGVRLPAGYWERENKQYLLKQAAEQNARRNRATSAGSPVLLQNVRKARNMPPSEQAIEEDTHSNNSPMPVTRRYSEIGAFGAAPETPDWSVGNIQVFGGDAISRRHSFAHYGSHTSTFQHPTLDNTQEEDEEELSPRQSSESPSARENFDLNAYFSGLGPASRAINASAISAAHPDPVGASAFPYQPHFARPTRRFFVVAFKCSRAEVFYIYDNTGLEIRRGDLVVCEGDRGMDLGQVIHADVTLEDAKRHKTAASEEHLRWLVMFSQYSVAGNGNNNPMLGALARAHTPSNNNVNRPQAVSMGAQQDPDAKPKMIKRLAQQHEIYTLREKEGSEAKAKRLAVAKTSDHGFPMEILDAEFQADNHKITFFYYAEHYVNFNPLVADLFKHYKIRIWMSAVNPASVINPAGMMNIPPPSAIGPGAIIHSNTQNASLSVGPGFGNNSYRPNEQRGRGRDQATQQQQQQQQQSGYQDAQYAFAHQISAYTAQQGYQMPWGQSQHMGYGFPNAMNSASPMNYGAWYPPTTYSASPAFNNASSGTSYRGGYPATTSAATSTALTTYGGASAALTTYGGASTAGPMYGQYQSPGMQMPSYSTAGPAYGQHSTSGIIAPGSYSTAPGFGQESGHGTSTALTVTSGATAGPVTSTANPRDMSTVFANMSMGK